MMKFWFHLLKGCMKSIRCKEEHTDITCRKIRTLLSFLLVSSCSCYKLSVWYMCTRMFRLLPLGMFFIWVIPAVCTKPAWQLRTFRGHEDIWTSKQSKGVIKLKKRWLTVSLQLKSALVDLLSFLHNPVIPYSRPQLIATENTHTDAPHSF